VTVEPANVTVQPAEVRVEVQPAEVHNHVDVPSVEVNVEKGSSKRTVTFSDGRTASIEEDDPPADLEIQHG
jgi:hypothetical protein